jgi:transcriptional regulator with AAA-type ATPase domain
MSQGGSTLSLEGDASDPRRRTAELALCLALSGDEPMALPACWSLAAFDEVTIGRGDALGCRIDGRRLAIAIRDRFASAVHVRLWRCPGGWAIEDASSKNGTSLNGTPCIRAELGDGDGDRVALGATYFQLVELPPSAGGAAAPALASFTPDVRELHDRLAAIAPTDVPVLLLGESGVGKEVTARAIHALSGRTGGFVGVNCGALPETLIEAMLFGHRRGAFTGAHDSRPGFIRTAHRGTLFLDEVGELSPAAQAALLRVLQEREVVAVGDTEATPIDVRVIAATNRDLAAEIARGRFRTDLHARLAGLTARLIPLRERRADLGLLIHALLHRLAPASSAVRIAAPAARALFEYDWPHNVRELEMCLRTAGALAGWGKIALRHLPEPIAAARAADPQRHELSALLEAHRGNLAAVARALGTSRTQVHRLLKRCTLEPAAYRGEARWGAAKTPR